MTNHPLCDKLSTSSDLEGIRCSTTSQTGMMMDLTYGQHAIHVGMYAVKARERIERIGFLNRLWKKVDSVTMTLKPYSFNTGLSVTERKDIIAALHHKVVTQVNRLLKDTQCELTDLKVTPTATIVTISKRR